MSSRRDGDFLEVALGWIGGLVAGVVIGKAVGHTHKAQMEKLAAERVFILPETLEYEGEWPPEGTRRERGMQMRNPEQERILKWALGGGGLGVVFLLNGGPTPTLIGVVLLAIAGIASFRAYQNGVPFPWETSAAPDLDEQTEEEVEIDFSGLSMYTIRLPKTMAWDGERARRFMEQMLVKTHGQLTFQIFATPGKIEWRVYDLRRGLEPDAIKQAVWTYYPEADILYNRIRMNREWNEEPFYRYLMHFDQPLEFFRPIKRATDLKEFDPLHVITQEMSGLRAGERAIYTLYVAGRASFAYNQGEKMLAQPVLVNPLAVLGHNGAFDAGYRSVVGQEQSAVYGDADTQVFLAKLRAHVFQSFLMIQIEAPTFERVEEIARYDAHVSHFRNDTYSILGWPDDQWPNSIREIATAEDYVGYSWLGQIGEWLTNADQSWKTCSLILDAGELAALWHLPDERFAAPGVLWTSGRPVQMPRHLRDVAGQGVCLGTNTFAGRVEQVWLPDSERTTPMVIVGKAGVGKSNLLHHMVEQDIAQGKSVVVIDPHGKLVDDILACSIPEDREADVVLLDLNDTEHPAPLNPLRGLQGHVAVQRVVDIFDKLYDDLGDLPQTQDALANALLTLAGDPEATLWDVDRLFRDAVYRRRLLADCTDPVVLAFWTDEYDALSEAAQRQLRMPILRRIRSFYRSEALRAVVCHPDGLDLGSLVQQHKIVLLSLRARGDQIPEKEQYLIGALVVARLQMAAMTGAFADTPCYCTIDELQHFVTSSIDRVFSEARKFNLFMTVANQYLKQLAGNTLDAAMGNVGTLATFQVGNEDARALATYTKPGFDAADLVQLPKYTAALWMRFDDRSESAFSLTTPKPPLRPKGAGKRRERIVAHSREQYTPRTQADVLAWLNSRYAKEPTDAAQREESYYEE